MYNEANTNTPSHDAGADLTLDQVLALLGEDGLIKAVIEKMQVLSQNNAKCIEDADSDYMRGYFEGKTSAYKLASEAIQYACKEVV